MTINWILDEEYEMMMVEHAFETLIYTFDAAAGEALGKRGVRPQKLMRRYEWTRRSFDPESYRRPHPNTLNTRYGGLW